MNREEKKQYMKVWYQKNKGRVLKKQQKIRDDAKIVSTLENKIADIKANCDLAIEGRDIKIMELETENNKLLDVINNQDVKIADLEQKLEQTEKDLADYQFNYPSIKELSKENAELKEKINILENCDRLGDMITEAYKEQLTKANEILEELANMEYVINPPADKIRSLMVKAEQFISEVEK